MKKTIPALLLIAAMLFSLCACSGAPAQNAAPEAAKTEAQENNADTPADSETATEAAATPEPTPEPEPEPEKLYRMEERELLVQKSVFGRAVSARNIPTGRAFDAVTDYVYDEHGEPVSETTTGVHRVVRISESSDPDRWNSYYDSNAGGTKLDVDFILDDAGRIVGETWRLLLRRRRQAELCLPPRQRGGRADHDPGL